MLVQSGIILIKYWFAISPEEQERRFKSRLEDPRKRWKIGPIDVVSRAHWFDYSRARDEMLKHTDTEEAPWYMVGADVKRHARPELYPPPLTDDPVAGDPGRAGGVAGPPKRPRLRAPPARHRALGP